MSQLKHLLNLTQYDEPYSNTFIREIAEEAQAEIAELKSKIAGKEPFWYENKMVENNKRIAELVDGFKMIKAECEDDATAGYHKWVIQACDKYINKHRGNDD